MSSVSVVEEKMDADFDEETPFSSSSPSSASKATNNTFNFETKVALPLPKSSIFNLLRTRRISRSIYVVLIKAKINMLLPFGPLAILLHYITGKHVCNIMLACLLAYFFLFNNYYLLSFNYNDSKAQFFISGIPVRDGSSSSPYWVLLLWQNVLVMLLSTSLHHISTQIYV